MKKRFGPVLFVLATLGALLSPLAPAQDRFDSEAQPFTQAELDSILAPIALYPDSVLSHVLIASTYPLEVIQAARWSRDNPGLDGELAVAAVEDFDWDPSVRALTAFPELLARMDEDIEWTQQIGDAFLIQEAAVIAAIQGLRDRAYAQGHLRSNEHVRVVREERVIYIEPARTRYVYLPYYDPRVVYGRWWWDAYPPFRWHHPRYHTGVSFFWGAGFRIAPTFYFSAFHWPRKRVVVVHHHHYPRRHFRSGREVARYHRADHWRHDPHHRRGVKYRHRVESARLVERSTEPTRRADLRQRSVADQRRWASSRRSDLDLRAASARQLREPAARGRSPAGDSSARRAAARQSNAVASRSSDRAAVQSQRRSNRDLSQRSVRNRLAERSSRSEVATSRRARATVGEPSSRSPSIERSSRRTLRDSSSSRRSLRSSDASVSSSASSVRVPRSLDVTSRAQPSAPTRELRRAAPRQSSAPRRQASPPPRASSRARVQSRASSNGGERQRRRQN
jgi:hypothetical protein